MPLQVWEIYDADDEDLVRELEHVSSLVPGDPSAATLQMLIQQELEERGLSAELVAAMHSHGTSTQARSTLLTAQGGNNNEPPTMSSERSADVASEASDEDNVPAVVWKDAEETKMTVIQAAMQAYQAEKMASARARKALLVKKKHPPAPAPHLLPSMEGGSRPAAAQGNTGASAQAQQRPSEGVSGCNIHTNISNNANKHNDDSSNYGSRSDIVVNSGSNTCGGATSQSAEDGSCEPPYATVDPDADMSAALPAPAGSTNATMEASPLDSPQLRDTQGPPSASLQDFRLCRGSQEVAEMEAAEAREALSKALGGAVHVKESSKSAVPAGVPPGDTRAQVSETEPNKVPGKLRSDSTAGSQDGVPAGIPGASWRQGYESDGADSLEDEEQKQPAPAVDDVGGWGGGGIGWVQETPDPAPLAEPNSHECQLEQQDEAESDESVEMIESDGVSEDEGCNLDAELLEEVGGQADPLVDLNLAEFASGFHYGDHEGVSPWGTPPHSAIPSPRAASPGRDIPPMVGGALSPVPQIAGACAPANVPPLKPSTARAPVKEGKYSRCYTYFEEIFTAFTRGPSTDGEAGANKKRPPRPDAAHAAQVMQSCLVQLNTWIAADQANEEDDVHAPRDDIRTPSVSHGVSAGPSAGGEGGDEGLATRYFRIGNVLQHPEVYALVTQCMEQTGDWAEDPTPSPTVGWNLMWTWSAKLRAPLNEMLVWQKINHFPRVKELCRKDSLKRHVQRYNNMFPSGVFDFMPHTYNLPKEYVQFVDGFSRAADGEEARCGGGGDPHNIWIMKPTSSSRGRGIFLIDDIGAVSYGEPMIVQRYLSDPLLVDGFKFDLRLYVLVTSFSPLEAFFYQEGFARMTTEKYTAAPDSITNLFVHLTNSSVQKTRHLPTHAMPAPCRADGCVGGPKFVEGGTKCSLARLFHFLKVKNKVDKSDVWSGITDVVLKALFATQDVIPHATNCFELLGFDILIDAALKPWLIEVNSSPSLACDTPLDAHVKGALVRDVLQLLDPINFNRKALQQVLHRRLTAGRSKSGLGTMAEDRDLLNMDLEAILCGHKPRLYGEMPAHLGLFERIAPSKGYDKLLRLKNTSARKVERR